MDVINAINHGTDDDLIELQAESGIEEAVKKVTFDRVAEDESIQDIVSVLDLLLNAKVEYNGKGHVTSHQISARITPIKVKLNTPKFSGKSRDFAIYKKEFMDVIVPGSSDPEIGALLREGLNTKEKNLLAVTCTQYHRSCFLLPLSTWPPVVEPIRCVMYIGCLTVQSDRGGGEET